MRGSCAGFGPLEFGVPITPLPRTMKLGDWKHEPDGTFVVSTVPLPTLGLGGNVWVLGEVSLQVLLTDRYALHSSQTKG